MTQSQSSGKDITSKDSIETPVKQNVSNEPSMQKDIPGFEKMLSSTLYHEYILTLNTLKAQLDRIDTITKLVLNLDHDHACNMKNVVTTLNDMIDRMPALRSIPKINYHETASLWQELQSVIKSPPSAYSSRDDPTTLPNSMATSMSTSVPTTRSKSDFHSMNKHEAQKPSLENTELWNGAQKSIYLRGGDTLNDSFTKNFGRSDSSNNEFSGIIGNGNDSMDLESYSLDQSTIELSDTIDEVVSRLRHNPQALGKYFNDLCRSFENDSLTAEIDPYQLSKNSFPLLVQYLVDKVLNDKDRFFSGIRILILCQLNGVTPLFKAVSQSLREELIEVLCEKQMWIDEGCNTESINLLKQLYSYLKRITHSQVNSQK